MTAAAAPARPADPSLDVDYATTLLAEHGVTVAGRSFAISQRLTFRQTAYVQKWRRAAKLDEMLKHFNPTSDEKLSSFVEDLIVESFENDQIFHLLAGGMVEVKRGQPQPWTKADAERLAEFLAELSDPADQLALHRAIIGVLASFFLARIVGAWASPNSSEGPSEGPTPDANDPSPSQPSQAPARPPVAEPVDLSDRILASMPEQQTQPEEAVETSAHSTS